jgi:hypothetical protein
MSLPTATPKLALELLISQTNLLASLPLTACGALSLLLISAILLRQLYSV